MRVPVDGGRHQRPRLCIGVAIPHVVEWIDHEEMREVALHTVQADGLVRVPVESAHRVAFLARGPAFADCVVRELR